MKLQFLTVLKTNYNRKLGGGRGKTIRNSQFTIRNSQFAIRNSQFGTCNLELVITEVFTHLDHTRKIETFVETELIWSLLCSKCLKIAVTGNCVGNCLINCELPTANCELLFLSLKGVKPFLNLVSCDIATA